MERSGRMKSTRFISSNGENILRHQIREFSSNNLLTKVEVTYRDLSGVSEYKSRSSTPNTHSKKRVKDLLHPVCNRFSIQYHLSKPECVFLLSYSERAIVIYPFFCLNSNHIRQKDQNSQNPEINRQKQKNQIQPGLRQIPDHQLVNMLNHFTDRVVSLCYERFYVAGLWL